MAMSTNSHYTRTLSDQAFAPHCRIDIVAADPTGDNIAELLQGSWAPASNPPVVVWSLVQILGMKIVRGCLGTGCANDVGNGVYSTGVHISMDGHTA